MGQFGRETEGLKIIKVKTSDLLTKIKENREKHITEFEKAEKGFMIDSEQRLKKALKEVRAGKKPERVISFEKPESHAKDYDAIIDMLEMTVDEELDITYEQFQRYARDQWDWTEKFQTLSAVYNSHL